MAHGARTDNITHGAGAGDTVLGGVPYWTPAGLAAHFGVNRSYIYYLGETGRIATVPAGGRRYLIPAASAAEFETIRNTRITSRTTDSITTPRESQS